MTDRNEASTGVPLLDLIAQYRGLQEEIRAALDRVIESQRFIMGPEVEALENETASYCGTAHALGVSSGTDALLLALMALGVGPGDEIVTTPYTFFATAGSVHRLGARIVFVDIDPSTFNLDVGRLEPSVTERTRVILPVHLFGRCADMAPLLEIARRRGLRVVEDAAQAIGAEYSGKRAGSLGDVGCFSFFPSKNLGAFGDGGMVTTGDSDLQRAMRVLREHGGEARYHHKVVGGNFRLDALQAAVLRVKLRYLDQWSEARRANAEDYNRRLAGSGLAEETIVVPDVPVDRHIFNQYVLRVPDRDGLLEHLRSRNIGCAVYYPVPLHLQECFHYLGYREGDFPESERAARETIALPVYPELTDSQRARVVEEIVAYYRRT